MFRVVEVRIDLTNKKKTIIKDFLISYKKTAYKIESYQWMLFSNKFKELVLSLYLNLRLKLSHCKKEKSFVDFK